MTRTELKTKRLNTLLLQKRLTRKPSSICISKHNTILALRNSETKEITHLISPKERNGLVVVTGNEKELYVPRYEPKTAKAWLKEIDDAYNKQQEQVQQDCGFHFEKCTMSEHQLNLVILKQVKHNAKYLKVLCKMSDGTLLQF